MSDTDNLCRICANYNITENAHKLFERSKKDVLKQISELTGVMLKNTKNLPQAMCIQCEEDLKQAYAFRELCIKTQKYFKSTEYKAVCCPLLKKDAELPEEKPKLPNKFIKEEKNGESDADIMEMEVPVYLTEEVLLKGELMEANGNSSDDYNILESAHEDDEFLAINSGKLAASGESSQPCSSDDEPLIVKKRAGTKRKRLKSGEKSLICDKCGNHFTSRHNFRIHLRRHAGEKPFQCEVCPDKFFTNSELRRHMRRHTGERPFACKHCGRRFTDYSTRTKHERTHTNERPFACTQCGKAFTTGYVLKNHMLVHTGERSFRCTLCNKSFQRQTHLIVHYRSLMHKQNEERQQLTNVSVPL